jgi:hypothetical protein
LGMRISLRLTLFTAMPPVIVTPIGSRSRTHFGGPRRRGETPRLTAIFWISSGRSSQRANFMIGANGRARGEIWLCRLRLFQF